MKKKKLMNFNTSKQKCDLINEIALAKFSKIYINSENLLNIYKFRKPFFEFS